MLDAFWSVENNSLTMTSKYRMAAVAKMLADEIRSWAPDPGHARICYLAINETADRLIRDTTHDIPTKLASRGRGKGEDSGSPLHD